MMDSQRTSSELTPTNLCANIQKNNVVEHIYAPNLPHSKKNRIFALRNNNNSY